RLDTARMPPFRNDPTHTRVAYIGHAKPLRPLRDPAREEIGITRAIRCSIETADEIAALHGSAECRLDLRTFAGRQNPLLKPVAGEKFALLHRRIERILFVIDAQNTPVQALIIERLSSAFKLFLISG